MCSSIHRMYLVVAILCCIVSTMFSQGSTTQQGIRFIHPTSTTNAISLVPPSSITSYTLTLPGTQGAASSYLLNDGSGNLSWATLSSSTLLSSITAATATNSINSADYAQMWAWNTLSSNSALTLSSTSTAAASNTQKLLNISLSGANGTASQTTYGQYTTNTHTGTTSTNVAGYFSASGGTNNYGLIVAAGNVGIGTSTPTVTLHNITTDAATATTTIGETVGHNSSGTPAASFGVGTKYTLESSTTADQDASQISTIWTTATHASRTSALTFSTVTSAAALAETMRITNGQVGINTTSITSGSTLDTKGHIALSNGGTASELRFYEPSGSGSNYTAFKAQAQTADVTYTLPAADGSNGQVLTTNGSGALSWATASGTTALSSITAATGTNSINSSDFGQTWAWNTLSSTSALTLSSTSTAAASNTQTLLNIALSGANATATQTTYGMQVVNTHTGTSSTNIAGYFSASGGTNNYGLLIANGNVGIGNSAPLALQHNTVTNGGTGLMIETASDGISYLRFVEDPSLSGGGVAFKYDGAFANNHLEINDNITGLNILTLKRSGVVGVGTTSVTTGAELDVKGHIALSNSGTASEVRFYEPSGSGSNYTALKAQVQAADVTYTLPAADGTNGSFLQTNGSGSLTWTTIGKEVVKYKAADESVSSATTGTTLQNDDDLNFTVSANEKYMIDILLDVTGSVGNMKVAFTLPSGTMALNMCANLTSGNTSHVHEWLRTSGTASSAITITNNVTSISIKGIVSIGGTGGTAYLQWAQNTSNATATTVKTLSNMRVVRIE